MTQSPCGTARVATVPRSGISRASGHVPTSPRGISVTGTGSGSSGISEDADNLLILGSDLKPFISCLIIDECLDGRFEPLGAVEDAFADHLAAANPHAQYLLAANYNIADALDFTDTTGIGSDGYSVQWDQGTGKFVLAEVIGITDHGDLTGLEDNDHPQYLLSTAYTAADVLDKLLTVDADNTGLNATTLQGYTPASFDVAGAAAAAISAHLGAADPHSQYLFDSQVSAYGLTLIDDANAAAARSTLELGTMALETAANYLLASGATVGAASQAQRLSLGAIFPANSRTYTIAGNSINQLEFTEATAGSLMAFSASAGSLIFSAITSLRFPSAGNLTLIGDSLPQDYIKVSGASHVDLTMNHYGEFRVTYNSGSTQLGIDSSGRVFVGQASATTLLDIAASTTARASLRLRTGVAPTSPNAGDMWTDGADFYGRGAASYSFGAVVRTTAIRPLTDSTTALQMQNAAGTAVVTVDTTNGRVKVGNGVTAIDRPLVVAHDTLPELIIKNTTSGQAWGVGAFGDFTINDRGPGSAARFAIAPAGGFDFRSAANSTIFSIGSTGTLGVIQPLTVTVAGGYGFVSRSGAAGSFSGLAIGRTSNDGILAVVHSVGSFVIGSAVGDLVLRGDTAGVNIAAVNASGEIRFATGTGATVKAVITNAGYLALGQLSATALLDIAASTTTRASLRLRSGVAPTSPNDGDIWYDGTHFYGRAAGVTKQLDN